MALSPNSKKGAGIAGIAAAIIAAVFTVEGGYVNDPSDPGGETNHGITKQVAEQHGYTAPMKDMSAQFAASIYYDDYIQKPGYVPLIQESPALGEKVVNAAVNVGVPRSSRWLQTGLNALLGSSPDFRPLTVDGHVGGSTIAAYQRLETIRGKIPACELMIKTIDSQQGSYYMSLTNLRKYTVGWMTNRVGNVPLSECKSFTGIKNDPGT